METKQEIELQKKFIEKVKLENKNKELKYAILTMGCQLNENDSEKLSGMIEQMGYTKVEDFKEADLCLFNTCCVRENAEEKLFGKLGEIKRLFRDGGSIKVSRSLKELSLKVLRIRERLSVSLGVAMMCMVSNLLGINVL